MPTLQGFHSDSDVISQLIDAGATIKLPFVSPSPLEVEQNPFEGLPPENVVDAEGRPLSIEVTS